ncbi:MAG: imidazole glycerol phosphate synthase subunit HisH [Solirubrobacterales bacterium]|nr:imidazole glycerol phosphate synthase subunit HisH [Solirubrobacterales bacterium]
MSAGPPQLKIADYGMGNLRSVAKAFEHVGVQAAVSSDPAELAAAEGIVLPGVGAFPEAMREIGRRGIGEPIASRAAAGVPVLGICLGMQLLFESSAEHGGSSGLGLLPGTVEPLRAPGLKLPHIGWAHLRLEREAGLTAGIRDGEPFYFVHSFAAHPEPGDLIASAEYGERFAAVVGRGNVLGTQFHPEKSSAAGLRMLANFAAMTTAPATA